MRVNMKIYDYRELRVWRKAIKLAVEVYRVTDTFPKQEQFGLSSQMRRAAVSISSNLAEGSRRSTGKDYHRFVTVAFGSASELESQVIIAAELGFLNISQRSQLFDSLIDVSKMLSGLERSLRHLPPDTR